MSKVTEARSWSIGVNSRSSEEGVILSLCSDELCLSSIANIRLTPDMMETLIFALKANLPLNKLNDINKR